MAGFTKEPEVNRAVACSIHKTLEFQGLEKLGALLLFYYFNDCLLPFSVKVIVLLLCSPFIEINPSAINF